MLRLSGESREVTAMFTDIEGFTSLTDRSDASDVLRVLDDYLIVTDIVVAHDGMVDKLIGDGVFALFNAPLDLADHAHHAVAAAKAIVAATENYRKTPSPQNSRLAAPALALNRAWPLSVTSAAVTGSTTLRSVMCEHCIATRGHQQGV